MKKRKLRALGIMIVALALAVFPLLPTENGNVYGAEYTVGAGGADYTSVTEAANAAEDGATIKLITDITENVQIAAGKTVTLDLNGNTLSTKTEGLAEGEYADAISNHGNLTITDSVGDGAVTAPGTASGSRGGAVTNYADGTVTIDGGTFNSNGWYTLKNMGTMTVNDGVVKQANPNSSGASLVANGWYGKTVTDRGEPYPTGDAAALLTINGGTFTSSSTTSTIKSDDWSKTIINGGTIKAQKGFGVQVTGDVEVNGGSIDAGTPFLIFGFDGDAWPGLLSITGGTITGETAILSDAGERGSVTISGGTFNVDPTPYAADGYVVSMNEDGTFAVAEEEPTPTEPAEPTPTEPTDSEGEIAPPADNETDPVNEEKTDTKAKAGSVEAKKGDSPKTDDTFNNGLMIALLLMAASTAVATYRKTDLKNNK